MKKSIFAKILIMILCLSLVLCACGEDTPKETDPTVAPTTGQPTEPSDPTDPSDPADPSDPTDPSTPPADPENPEDPEKPVDPENPDDPEKPVDPENPDDPADGPSTPLGGLLEEIFGSDVGSDELLESIQAGKITITVGDTMTNVMFVDIANLKFVDQLTVNVEGTELTAQIYANEHDLVVAVPEILPEAYGVSFDTLMEDLPNSAIWGLMGITYEEFMAQLSATLDEVLSSMNGMGNMEDIFNEDTQACLNSLVAALEKALENVEQSTTTGQVDIYGEYVDALIVSYSVDNDAMESIVNILLDWCIENSEDIATILDSAELTDEMILEALNEAKLSVGEFFDNADLDAALVLNMNAETGALMSVDASFAGIIDGVEDGIYLNLTLGKNPAESDLYSFSLVDAESTGVSVTFGCEVVETTTTLILTAAMLEYGDPTSALVATASYDTASYEYALTLDVDGEYYAVEGICKITEEIFEFSIDTLTNNDEVIELNLKVVAETISSDEIPTAPDYTNLLQMSEMELTSLLMTLEGIFG